MPGESARDDFDQGFWHKMRSIFKRYNIVSEVDFSEATQKLDAFMSKDKKGMVMKRGVKQKIVHSVPCKWCKDDERRLYCKGLCQRCYKIAQKRSKAETASASASHVDRSECSRKKYECQVAKRMEDLARWEGEQYGSIKKQEVDGMRIEMELRFMSKRFVGKELFFGCSDIFDWEFKPKKKRIIFEFLAEMMRQYLQKRRQYIAKSTAQLETEWHQYI
jgi:hypothetical protein